MCNFHAVRKSIARYTGNAPFCVSLCRIGLFLIFLCFSLISEAQTLDRVIQAIAPAVSGNSDGGHAVVRDLSGNIYVTGRFSGTADFDPSVKGIANLTSSESSSDVFIAKYKASGQYVWAVRFGNSNGEAGVALAVDTRGNVYVTGHFQETVDFDPSDMGTDTLTSTGSWNIFIAKFNSEGRYRWAKKLDGTKKATPSAIATDDAGNFYLTGRFEGSANFDPAASATALRKSRRFEDGFLAKYDSDGKYLWVNQIDGEDVDAGCGVIVDNSGNPCITGIFRGTIDFDPGATYAYLTSDLLGSTFIAKYNTTGSYLWAKDRRYQ